MLTRTLGSFTSSDRFAEVIAFALLLLVIAKFPQVLLFPLAIALAVIPSVLIYAFSVTKPTFFMKVGIVLMAGLLEAWAALLFASAYAFAYGKPFLSFLE